MEETTARLRKTFKIPLGDELEDKADALDEEEQEDLINHMQTANQSSNARYTSAFLSIPLVSILPYLLTISHSQTSLLSLLSITSLLSSAYILYYFPHDSTGMSILDRRHKLSVNGRSSVPLLKNVVDRGPLESYLAMMNAVLCTLLLLGGLLLKSGSGFQGFGFLPGAVFVTILFAKGVMAGVDVDELERLRYGYKGA